MRERAAYPYETRLNILYPALEVVEIQPLIDACQFQWYNQTLCKVNDSVVRLGVMQGEYHWHKHDADDEFFYVVEGQFIIDLEGRWSHSARDRASSYRAGSRIARARPCAA